MAATGFIHQIPFYYSLIHCTSLYQLLVDNTDNINRSKKQTNEAEARK